MTAEQIQSAIDCAKRVIKHAISPDLAEVKLAIALIDVYGRLQEADQDRLLRILDQYGAECGNCGCGLIARGGSLGEHHGLTAKDSGSEDEQLCGYCAGLELADASAKLRDLDIANDQLITDETVLRAELTEAKTRIGVFEIFCRDICEVTATAPEDVDTSGASLPVLQIKQWSLDSAELTEARINAKCPCCKYGMALALSGQEREPCHECKGTALVAIAYETCRVHYKLQGEALTEARRQLEMIRKAIEDAPHESGCGRIYKSSTSLNFTQVPCNCWKSQTTPTETQS